MSLQHNRKKPIKEIKVCCIGSSGAGKTCLIIRFVNNRFEQHSTTTLAAAFLTKTLSYKDYDLKLQIWDTAGQERFRSLTRHYYRNADVVIIVYDITSRVQYEEAKVWVSELNRFASENVILAIVGTKIDLEEKRQVTSEEGHNYAESIGAVFIETSARSGYHVEFLFDEINGKLPDTVVPPSNENNFRLLDQPKKKKSNCCN